VDASGYRYTIATVGMTFAGLFSLAMDIAALCLAANAIVIPGELLAGVYAAAVTAILIGAGTLFLFTFVYWYDATIDHEQAKS
jgi:hypothetical protein